MREIADLAGVSVSTVSAVLNGNKYVSAKLMQRVRTAAEQVGYTDGPRKNTLHSRARRKIGVVLPGLYNAFFPQLLNGMGDATSESGYDLLLCDSNRAIKKEKDILDMLARQGVKDIVVDSVCDEAHAQEYFTRIRKQMIQALKMNVVVLEREVVDDAFHSIFVDNYHMSYEATKHLIDLGHRRIAHIGGPGVFPHSRIRAQGYKMALLEQGIPYDEHLLEMGDFSPISGYAAMKNMLDKGIRPTAVFAANDQMGIGAMKAIKNAGLSIPGDIAVIGFDNLPIASLVDPGLTSVQCFTYQMGFRAVRMLVDCTNSVDHPRRIKIDAQLVVRRSTVPTQQNDWNLLRW